MTRKASPVLSIALSILCLASFLAIPFFSSAGQFPEIRSSFEKFLATYVKEIKRGNTVYLKAVHPKLPEEMNGFFIGITMDMMKYADENNLSPTITCREYEICKVTWPQPGDSWAAQTFVRHDGNWKWLDY